VNIIIIVIIVIGLFTFALFMLKSNVAMAKRGKLKTRSVYLRIMASYFQLIVLINAFQLEWPDFVLEFQAA
jgi:hypothetical protein